MPSLRRDQIKHRARVLRDMLEELKIATIDESTSVQIAARMEGTEEPEARHPGGGGKAVRARWARSSVDDPAEAERLRRQHEIKERLFDLLEVSTSETVALMCNVAIEALAKRSPPSLSADDRKKIQENYPHATPALIAERSMDELSLRFFVGVSMTAARIAIDYSPISNCKAELESDDSVDDDIDATFRDTIDRALKQATDGGMSAFGAATTAIYRAMDCAMRNDVPWPLMVRPLVDGYEFFLRQAPALSKQPINERAQFAYGQLMARLSTDDPGSEEYRGKKRK